MRARQQRRGRSTLATALACACACAGATTGATRAAAAATTTAGAGAALLREGTYLVAAGKPGTIKEKFKVTRTGGVVTSVADAMHPAGKNLHVVTRTDAATGALIDMTVEMHAKSLPDRTIKAVVSPGHVHFTDDAHGTDAKLALKVGALPLFIDPGGLLAHQLTLLTQRYDWAKGGTQTFWIYNPGFTEMQVHVVTTDTGTGKRKGKTVATRWLTLTCTELTTLRIEVDGDDYAVLRVLGPKDETLVTLEGYEGGPAPGTAKAPPPPPASLPGLKPPAILR
jgi:hypothetical protein